jgi:predicted MFS family arabinose efflux permease
LTPQPPNNPLLSILLRPAIQSRLATLQTLRLPAYRYVVLSAALNNMAVESRLMAQAWLILSLTNSDAWVGTIAGFPAIVAAATALFGGVLADRLERRRIVVVVYLALSAVALFYAFLVTTEIIQIWQMFVMAFAIALMEVSARTASQTMIVDTVPREELFNANALFSAAVNLAVVVGPAIAGLILAHAGVSYTFAFSAAMFIASAVAASFVQVENRRQGKSTTTVWQDFKGGLRFVVETPALRWLLLVGLSVIAGGAWLALVPRYAKDVLEIGATGYGSILSARGAGGLVGVLLLLATGRVERLGAVLVGSFLCFTLLATLFALSNVVFLAILAAFGIGIIFSWYPNALRTAFQFTATEEMRGRVMSLFALVGQLVTFGWFVGGSLSEWIGPQLAIIILAVAGSAIHLLGWVRSPELRSLGRN